MNKEREALIPQLLDSIIDKYTSAKPAPTEREPDDMTVWLDVGAQHFRVANADNEEHAEWYRKMLAEAIAKIVVEQALSDKPITLQAGKTLDEQVALSDKCKELEVENDLLRQIMAEGSHTMEGQFLIQKLHNPYRRSE